MGEGVRGLIVWGLAAGLAGCSATAFRIPEDARPIGELPAPAAGSAVLGPGDVLQVVFFGREEMSGEFPVDEAGEIQYPLAGRLKVAGLTGEEAVAALTEALRPFFNNPVISARPLIRVNVLGAVVRPGLYPVDPTLNVFDAIGAAGGPSRDANFEEILLVRGGDYYVVDTRETLRLGRSLTLLGIRSGDVILVPERGRTLENIARMSVFVSAAATLLNTVLILTR
jgi:polysaccharide export outer membrane protein